jgi:hypothetical protein
LGGGGAICALPASFPFEFRRQDIRVAKDPNPLDILLLAACMLSCSSILTVDTYCHHIDYILRDVLSAMSRSTQRDVAERERKRSVVFKNPQVKKPSRRSRENGRKLSILKTLRPL